MKLPANINRTATLYLHYHAQNYPHIAPYMNSLKASGWQFYVVKHNRGRCYPFAKVITVPIWAYDHTDKEYRIWYLAHEMAHAAVAPEMNHGDRFMQALIELCPAHLLKYEIEYKPRNAKRNGIYNL